MIEGQCNGKLYLMGRPMGSRTQHIWTCSACGREFNSAAQGDLHFGIVTEPHVRTKFSTLPWFGPQPRFFQ